LIGRIVLAR